MSAAISAGSPIFADIAEDGRFGYPSLPLYWSEPGRYPFLIRMDGKLAGLALVKRGSEVSGSNAVWDMAEFFVVRGCRGRGVGALAAHRVWRRFPGPWEVRVMQRNARARGFWSRAISTFAGEMVQPARLEKNGELWDLFSFQSREVDAFHEVRRNSPRLCGSTPRKSFFDT